ncbi:MAG: PH domain-containing protein [Candidatus Binatia bacterium]
MRFAAELGWKEKIWTGVVGAGIVLFVVIAVGASGGNFRDAHFTVPIGILVVVLTIALGFRPIGYELDAQDLVVDRPFRALSVPYSSIRAVRAPSEYPTIFTIGLWRAEGLFGSYGLYWNRPWGLFRVFVTDSSRLVEIVLEDGSRLVISPSGDPREFRDALMARARLAGAEIAFAT